MKRVKIVLTERERFMRDLLDSGRSYEVVLNREFAVRLLRDCHRRRRLGYKPARDQVLEDAYVGGGIVTEDEWDAYKDFIDRRFQWRSKAQVSTIRTS